MCCVCRETLDWNMFRRTSNIRKRFNLIKLLERAKTEWIFIHLNIQLGTPKRRKTQNVPNDNKSCNDGGVCDRRQGDTATATWQDIKILSHFLSSSVCLHFSILFSFLYFFSRAAKYKKILSNYNFKLSISIFAKALAHRVLPK